MIDGTCGSSIYSPAETLMGFIKLGGDSFDCIITNSQNANHQMMTRLIDIYVHRHDQLSGARYQLE